MKYKLPTNSSAGLQGEDGKRWNCEVFPYVVLLTWIDLLGLFGDVEANIVWHENVQLDLVWIEVTLLDKQ